MTGIDRRHLRHEVGKKSTATAGGRVRPIVCATALLLAASVGGRAALADMAVVQQDNTPVASAPGVGGRILARVDAGVTLTVLGREGEWLQVTSPQLQDAGTLWVPAGRVGDIIAAPAEMATAEAAPVAAAVPQFRMTTGSTGSATTTALGTDAAAGSKSSDGVSTSAARSTQANVSRVGTAAVQSSGTATPSAGDPTPAVTGNPTPAMGNSVTAVSGNPTPAMGNSVTAVSGNPTPAPGNPTPAVNGNPTPAVSGNPTPAIGNATPAMGNSVTGFGGTTVQTQ
jgi:hypothetical protein